MTKLKKYIPQKLMHQLLPPYHFIIAWLAALYYGFPSRRLIVIGVTGTTGKTTTVGLLAKLLSENGYLAGYSSTAQFNDGRKEWLNDKKMTMPGRFFLQRHLSRMLKNGCQVAIVETTSQGIEQFRHRFIDYDILLFTNLYPEHIEAHGGFKQYKEAKGKLFAHLKRTRTKYLNNDQRVVNKPSGLQKTELRRIKKTIIANADDEHASYFLSFWAEKKIVYGDLKLKNNACFLNEQEEEVVPKPVFFSHEELFSGAEGSDFIFQGWRHHLSILGSFNIINAASALSVASQLELEPAALAISLENIQSLPGKMEKIEAGQNYLVIVDYAFEPKAMMALYENLKLLSFNRLIHVLGSCGGGRDKARRAILGGLAGKRADIVITTDEDPYNDDPQEIIDQVAAGAENEGKKLDTNLFKILDRREAIRKAFDLANPGDLVLITGKGAEQFICVAGDKKIAWDDREVAREELQKIV